MHWGVSAHPSVLELRRRVEALPSALEQTLGVPLPEKLERAVSVGIGLSEAPARYLEAIAPRQVRAVAASAFCSESVADWGDTLVIFSQQLSANAQLTLKCTAQFRRKLLVTSVKADDPRLEPFRREGGEVVTLPPEREEGMLVRVTGPRCATFFAARLSRSFSDAELGQVPGAASRAGERAGTLENASDWLEKLPSMLTTGTYGRCVRGLAWTLMEGLWVEEPRCWDALQFIHGAFQQLAEKKRSLLLLRRPDDVPEVFDRLKQVLKPGLHTVLEVTSELKGALALFEHAAVLDRWMCQALEPSGRDLSKWPGLGADAPLYGWRG